VTSQHAGHTVHGISRAAPRGSAFAREETFPSYDRGGERLAIQLESGASAPLEPEVFELDPSPLQPAANAARVAIKDTKAEEPNSHNAPAVNLTAFSAWGSLSERLTSYAQGARWQTGIAPLDELLRGGIRTGKVLVIGGAPGAGKTTMADQLARIIAGQGAIVVVLEPDDPAGFDTRWLMSVGVSRDAAEAVDAPVLARAAELEKLPVFVAPPDTTLADVAAVLGRVGLANPGHQVVVVVDSLQKVHVRSGAEYESQRGKVEAVVETLKELARTYGAVVIATSELARGAYSSKQVNRQTHPLAAFKESGAIEYAADVAMVLRMGEGGLVACDVVKNRQGLAGSFSVRLDRDRATFEATTNLQDARPANDTPMVETVRSNPNLSKNKLARLAKMKKADGCAAIDRLVERGAIRNVGTEARPAYVVTDSSEGDRFSSVPRASGNHLPQNQSPGSHP